MNTEEEARAIGPRQGDHISKELALHLLDQLSDTNLIIIVWYLRWLKIKAKIRGLYESLVYAWLFFVLDWARGK